MRSGKQWNYTGVHHPKALDTIDPQTLVNDTPHLTRAQLARPSWVIKRTRSRANKSLQIVIAGHIAARHDLNRLEFLDRGSVGDLAGEPDALGEDCDVERVAQETCISVDAVEDVCRNCFDGASREWLLQAEDDAAVGPDELQYGGLVAQQLVVEDFHLMMIPVFDFFGCS